MRIYIAGKWEDQERLKRIRQEVEAIGHTVVGTWLDEVGSAYPSEMYCARYARRDLYEISVSNAFFLDTSTVNERGGREVEFGAALRGGLFTAVVGPLRNVFHRIAEARFENWTEALVWLAMR